MSGSCAAMLDSLLQRIASTPEGSPEFNQLLVRLIGLVPPDVQVMIQRRFIIPFTFSGHSIRVVIDDQGSPWFIAADVASALGYRDTPSMAQMLDDDEKDVRVLHPLHEDEQSMTVISVSGLYRCCIFSFGPQAGPFRRWVTRELLPSVRSWADSRLPFPEIR